MTASPARRRQATRIGAVLLGASLVAVVAVSVLAVATLRASREGRAPATDSRPVAVYPETPNAALAVVDDLDRLTSLVVATLDPSGVGGSLVVVPVNVDAADGVGVERRPLSQRPFAPGDEAQLAELLAQLEPLISTTIERGVVLGPAELADLLRPIAPLDVDLPEDVVDADAPGSGVVAPAGPSSLGADELVAALTAISPDGTSYSHHDVDVALWSAVAAAAPVGGGSPVPSDDAGRPLAPGSVDELLDRLLAGSVGARPLAVSQPADVENETDADFTIVDRVDALIVFASISPGLVSAPSDALSFRLVLGYGPDQLPTSDGEGPAVTKELLARIVVSELVFAGANVIAVDLADAPDDVPDVTRIEVVRDETADAIAGLVDQLYPGADVSVADLLVDRTDVTIVLGRDVLEARGDVLRQQVREAASATASTEPGTTDVAVEAGDGASTATSGDVGQTAPDGSTAGTSASSGSGGGTVDADG